VLDIANELHPDANLAGLTELLPMQLELGVPGPSAALALAGAELRREDYLRLIAAGFRSYQDIAAADDATILPLLRNEQASVERLRAAVAILETPETLPLSELLGPPDSARGPNP
jgi:hypothetical protein